MSEGGALSFIEEVVLLALDDAKGVLVPLPLQAFNLTLAGALLADLAVAGRIDTDPQELVVLKRESTGDPLLDAALEAIAAAAAAHPVPYWLNHFAQESERLEAAALDRLVARGVLRRENQRLLWIFGTRRYPTARHEERVEVRTRLAALILGDDLPDPRDAILISLLAASPLMNALFPGREFKTRGERVALLAKMDLVGREVAAGIEQVTRALASSLPPPW